MSLLKKLKMTAKNADSKAGEVIDKGMYKSKIINERSKISGMHFEIGETYYAHYETGEPMGDELDELCKKIDECVARIAEYEEAIERIEREGRKERDRNRAEAATEPESGEGSDPKAE